VHLLLLIGVLHHYSACGKFVFDVALPEQFFSPYHGPLVDQHLIISVTALFQTASSLFFVRIQRSISSQQTWWK